jgi:hypothetical protein
MEHYYFIITKIVLEIDLHRGCRAGIETRNLGCFPYDLKRKCSCMFMSAYPNAFFCLSFSLPHYGYLTCLDTREGLSE